MNDAFECQLLRFKIYELSLAFMCFWYVLYYSHLCQCWVFMSGTLEILYWQMRVKLESGPMRGWVTRKQWRLAEISVPLKECTEKCSQIQCWEEGQHVFFSFGFLSSFQILRINTYLYQFIINIYVQSDQYILHISYIIYLHNIILYKHSLYI